jgi:SNF2 family DNA or RNA helicase
VLRHLSLEYFAEKSEEGSVHPRGVIYIDGLGDIVDATTSLGHVNLKGPMDRAVDLMQYLVVVTTFSRIEAEFILEQKLGRLQERAVAVKTSIDSDSHQTRRTKRRRRDAVSDENDQDPSSPLLQIRWLRLIVDEGHELGSDESADTALTHFLNEIAAERRWVLSGTPTTGNEDDEQYKEKCLDQLQRLLCFLRHPVYGAVSSTTLDERNKIPFLTRQTAGRDELLSVLRAVLVMHQKDHVKLPMFSATSYCCWKFGGDKSNPQ